MGGGGRSWERKGGGKRWMEVDASGGVKSQSLCLPVSGLCNVGTGEQQNSCEHENTRNGQVYSMGSHSEAVRNNELKRKAGRQLEAFSVAPSKDE
jgi:hypothetical protein